MAHKAHILVCDDDKELRQIICRVLADENYNCSDVGDGHRALMKLATETFDVLLLDLNMPGMDGLELMEKLESNPRAPRIIVITAHGDIPKAIRATQLGAFDFIEKPFENERLLVSVKNAVAEQTLLREASGFRSQLQNEHLIIGTHRKIQDVRSTIRVVAGTDASILITGENGTGKDLAARNIHLFSERAHMPYYNLNCAALPDTLIESKLFGHKKGSFTGAQDQEGLFSKADGGTIFLNEIGEMRADIQAKLLQVIETGEYTPLGSNDLQKADVRIIAATNKDLNKAIEEKAFRRDLFYRLSVVEIEMPALRERYNDIVLLAEFMMERKCASRGLPQKQFDKKARAVLLRHEWPGNVRELSNLIERLIIFESDTQIDHQQVKRHLSKNNKSTPETPTSFREARSQWEKSFILKALAANNHNVTQTAEQLEIDRAYLHKMMKRLDINNHTD